MRSPAASASSTAKALATGFAALALAAPSSAPAQASPPACVHKAGGSLTVNVPSVEITPVFKLNGQPFPGAEAGVASFTLWASRPSELFDGPQLALGLSNQPAEPVRVVPGVYDVYYSWISGSDIPRNEMTRLLRGVVLRSDRVLPINVPMVAVQGQKLHNGAPFESGGSAAFRLRPAGRSGEVPLGGILPAAFSVRVIPGPYALEYDWEAGANLPQNRHAQVKTLSLAKASNTVALDVKSVPQEVAFLHNGEAFFVTAYERGDLFLTRGAREEVRLGSSHEGAAALRVIPGAYDVRWRHMAGANVPRNEDGLVRRGLVVNGAPRVIDVPSVEIEGDFLVGGAPPPSTAYETARLLLAVPGTSDQVEIGRTHYGSYQSRVLPGVYDVIYEHLVGGSVLPVNPQATLHRRWRVAAQPNRTFDIPVGRYAGAYLTNGESFPGSAYSQGHVYLASLEAGREPVLLGPTSYGAFDRPLLPGAYRAAYARDAGAELPWNSFTIFGPVVRVLPGVDPGLTDGLIDVPSGLVMVQYAHNGVALPTGGPENIRVHFQRGPNYLQWLDSDYGPLERAVIGGRFDLFYQFLGGAGLPKNAFMRLGCWDLAVP